MSDIKLFRLGGQSIVELAGSTDAVEKSLQTLFEQNLQPLLGVRFLASEYVTTNGRIDSLGVDENGCPVILEYKRATNENVINQGLFYLDWLMDHRKNFEWLVLEKFGKETADSVDWSAPRLICIAGDFNRYDNHAVKQIQRNIELIRYRRFGDEILMLDLVTTKYVKGSTLQASLNVGGAETNAEAAVAKYKTISTTMGELDESLTDRFEALRAYLTALGDDVQETTLLYYVAFKRIKNFACVEFRPTTDKILIYVKVDPESIALEPGFTRNVSNIGHYGTGDLEITLSNADDLERAKRFLLLSYNGS